jgi:hypothetical protein
MAIMLITMEFSRDEYRGFDLTSPKGLAMLESIIAPFCLSISESISVMS